MSTHIVIHASYILLTLALGTTALALGWTSEMRWFLSGVALLVYARAARSIYILARHDAFQQGLAPVWRRAEYLYVGGCLGAACLFAVAFFSNEREGWLSAGGAVYAVLHAAFHLYLARRSQGLPRVAAL